VVEKIYGVKAAIHTDENGRPYILPRRVEHTRRNNG
jgi:hypothetical protein